MANFRYFADLDGRTVQFDRVDYRSKSDIRGYDTITKAWLKVDRSVEYKARPSKHECDARCIHATGRTMRCECSCGGSNHGRGY